MPTTPQNQGPARRRTLKVRQRARGVTLITTTDTIPGMRVVKVLGLVSGNAVKTRHIGNDLTASFKTIVGGEVDEYASLMREMRQLATTRMETHATAMGANAICGVRYIGTEISPGCSELCAYGTAVICKPEDTPGS